MNIVADFIFSPSNPTTDDIIHFYDKSVISEGEIISWRWDFGDGTISFEQNAMHTFKQSGIYNVTLTVQNNKGEIATKTQRIVVRVGEVIFDVNITIIQGKPMFIVTTNLPEGMEFMFTISNETRILGQDKDKVTGGKIVGGPFSLQGNPYPPGIYHVIISSPLVTLQPPEVQEILGLNGEYVSGEFISNGMVNYETVFTIEG